MNQTTNFADVLRAKIKGNAALAQAVDDAAVNQHIAAEIYTARIAAGLTQTELASLAGTTQSVIARLEDANYEGHSLAPLKKIARALGLQLRVEFYAKPTYKPVWQDSLELTSDWPEDVVEYSFSSSQP